MQDETVIDQNTEGTMELLEKHLSDGSHVYAVRLKDRDDNFATFDCVTQAGAIAIANAHHEHTA